MLHLDFSRVWHGGRMGSWGGMVGCTSLASVSGSEVSVSSAGSGSTSAGCGLAVGATVGVCDGGGEPHPMQTTSTNDVSKVSWFIAFSPNRSFDASVRFCNGTKDAMVCEQLPGWVRGPYESNSHEPSVRSMRHHRSYSTKEMRRLALLRGFTMRGRPPKASTKFGLAIRKAAFHPRNCRHH